MESLPAAVCITPTAGAGFLNFLCSKDVKQVFGDQAFAWSHGSGSSTESDGMSIFPFRIDGSVTMTREDTLGGW